MQETSSHDVLMNLIEERNIRRGPLEWWYWLTALHEGELDSSLESRERARRSRLTSTILFGISVILILMFLLGFIIHNTLISFIMLGGGCLTCFNAFLNRRGYLTIVGIILLLQADGGQVMVFIHTPGGLDLTHMMLLDMLFVLGIVACISFFPPVGIFLCAAFNCIVLTLVLRFAPHAPDILRIINTPAALQYYLDPFLVQGLVAVFAFLWTNSANKAIARADRAHVIAELEHQIATQMKTMGAEKQLLEQSIHQILAVHVQVANGDLNARVPLSRDNVLWSLAGSLNTLLSRYRSDHYRAQQYRRLEIELSNFLDVLRLAKNQGEPIVVGQHGTLLDQLYLECNNHVMLRSNVYPASLFAAHPDGHLVTTGKLTNDMPVKNPPSGFFSGPLTNNIPVKNPPSGFFSGILTNNVPVKNPPSGFPPGAAVKPGSRTITTGKWANHTPVKNPPSGFFSVTNQ